MPPFGFVSSKLLQMMFGITLVADSTSGTTVTCPICPFWLLSYANMMQFQVLLPYHFNILGIRDSHINLFICMCISINILLLLLLLLFSPPLEPAVLSVLYVNFQV